jgi:hypothetical protein
METYSITEYIDFNWETYKNLNPYLYIIGLRTKEEYEKNYLQEGRYLGRYYKNEQKVSPHTFHILIATIGKISIFNMLNSLKNELLEQDYLTIVFDGTQNNYEIIKKYVDERFKCQINIILEKDNLGYWGHGIRNKYKNLEGDFIYHCDDDDVVLEGAFDKIRQICVHKDTIYLFKIKTEKGMVIWKNKQIKLMEISTQSGIIPNEINKKGYWALKYGGDYNFYKDITKDNKVLFINHLIYVKH